MLKDPKIIWKNLLVYRLYTISGKIDYNWLNPSFEGFKLNCKKLFYIDVIIDLYALHPVLNFLQNIDTKLSLVYKSLE